ncbi:hypothetical protein SynMVIR181_01255 [Synechococcus sp. MVIR-18-1]|nr:hypothetical protein SynMVIR181_01255 [Synechococcus sp. MVIR-18-1]
MDDRSMGLSWLAFQALALLLFQQIDASITAPLLSLSFAR